MLRSNQNRSDILSLNESKDKNSIKSYDKNSTYFNSNTSSVKSPIKSLSNNQINSKLEYNIPYCPIKSATYKDINIPSPKKSKRRARSPKELRELPAKFSLFDSPLQRNKKTSKKKVHFVPDDRLVEVIDVLSYKKYNTFKFTTNVKGLKFVDDDKDDESCISHCFIF